MANPVIETHHIGALERTIQMCEKAARDYAQQGNYDACFFDGDANALREVLAVLKTTPANEVTRIKLSRAFQSLQQSSAAYDKGCMEIKEVLENWPDNYKKQSQPLSPEEIQIIIRANHIIAEQALVMKQSDTTPDDSWPDEHARREYYDLVAVSERLAAIVKVRQCT